MQKFYCLCDGGLGNRLNSLVCGLIVWKKDFQDTEFIVVWPINRYCGAHIESLLNVHKIDEFVGHNVVVQLDLSAISAIKNYIILAHDQKGFDGSFTNVLSINGISRERLENKDSHTRHFLFSTPLLPFFIKFKDAMIAADFIEPSGMVKDQIQHKKSKIGTKRIALHLRGTDYGFSAFYFDIFFNFIRSFSFLRFQIFTDDKCIIERFSKLRNAYFFDASDLPEKFDPNSNWSHRTSQEYNVSRNDLSVINGFSELLVLASLPKIITSRSTFLYNAFFLSKRKSRLGFFVIFSVNRLISLVRYLKTRKK